MGQTNWGPITETPRVAGEGLEEAGRPSAAKTHRKGLWSVRVPRTVLRGAQTNKMHSLTTLTHILGSIYYMQSTFWGAAGEQSLDRTCTRSQLVLLLQRLLNEQSCVLVQETPLQEAPPTTASSGE